jgi:hypothetical protein
MHMFFFFNNRDKIEINNIKNSCASHMLLKKKKKKKKEQMSLLEMGLNKILPTQFGGKLCLKWSKLIYKVWVKKSFVKLQPFFFFLETKILTNNPKHKILKKKNSLLYYIRILSFSKKKITFILH